MIYELAPHIHLRGHSTDSKSLTVKEVADFFSDYDIITLVVHSTETNKEAYDSFVKECEKHSTSEKLIIPCLEDESKNYHALLIGAKSYTRDIYNPKREHITILAHPWGYAYQTRKIKKENLNLKELDGIEIWNLYHNSKKYPSLKTLNFFKNFPPNIKAYTGIDEHPPFKKNDVAIFIECEDLRKESVLKALKKGEFYSKVKDFAISSKGELKQNENPIGLRTIIKCMLHESLTHAISSIAVTGNNILNRIGIKNGTKQKIKIIMNSIRRNI